MAYMRKIYLDNMKRLENISLLLAIIVKPLHAFIDFFDRT